MHASEETYRSLVTNLNDVVYTVDAEGRITYISHQVESITGYKPSELLGRPFADFIHPEDLPGLLKVWQGNQEGKAGPAECRIAVKNGQYRFARASVRPRFEDGQFAGVAGILTDVTAQHEAESALRESEEKYRELFELSKDATSLARKDGTFIEVNQAWLDLFGFARGELPGVRAYDLYEVPSERDSRLLQPLYETGAVTDLDIRFRKKDGTVMDCISSTIARRDATGNIVAFQTATRDITGQKRAERALRESEEEFRALFELSRDAIALVRPDGTFIDVNHAWLDLFGFSREELPDITAFSLHENPAEHGVVLPKELRETGGITGAELRFRKKNGMVMDCLCNIVARRDETGAITVIQISTRDVTESNRARRELQDSRDKLNELHAYLVNGHEAERATIARELHDQTSQALNALKLDLSDLRRRAALGESVGPASLDRTMELVDSISGEVRRLSSDLRPGVLDDLGLSAAIEWNVQEFASRTGLRTSLQLSADDSTVAASCATTLFRILQELLSNVAHHARAGALSVGLRNSGDGLVLTVTDDGRGITDEEMASKESLGIISIRERVNLFGGSVVICGEPGKGTTVEVAIPLKPRLPE